MSRQVPIAEFDRLPGNLLQRCPLKNHCHPISGWQFLFSLLQMFRKVCFTEYRNNSLAKEILRLRLTVRAASTSVRDSRTGLRKAFASQTNLRRTNTSH